MKRLSLAVLFVLGTTLPAFAQIQGGTLAGVVKDEQGGVLPGAAVSAQGIDAIFTFTTDSVGEFRFLNIAPGPYTVSIALPGFATTVRSVVVTVGTSTRVAIPLKIASVAETVSVSAPAPILDARPAGTATSVAADELTHVPTSRDPFSLIRAVPGALVDRVNIAGNETGQQLIAVAKAARPQDTSWTMDGVEITDMAAAGQSAAYFNFDNFEEVHVSTAGNDIRERTGALTVDLTVKRGTNRFHGGARGYYSDDSMQASNIPAELKTIGVTDATADHVTRTSDYGFDLGGPLLRDRAWFHGSYSRQNVRLFRRTTGAIDRTQVDSASAKVNWQATRHDMVNFLFFNGFKVKDHRKPGLAAFETPDATFHQDVQYGDSPLHGLWKIGDERVFGQHVFVSAKYAYFNTGLALTPESGWNAQAGINNVTSTAYGSVQRQLRTTPQHTATIDAHSFLNAIGVSHDVKYGAGYRTTDAVIENMWPGNGIRAIVQSPADYRAAVYREGSGGNRANYLDFYAGDTLTRNRVTLDLGLRFDRQWGNADPSNTSGNPAFPDLVPGIVFGGYRAPFTWNTLSPRASVIYAFDDARRTLARVSYSRFAGQLATTVVGTANPASTLGSITYRWADLNGDAFVQPNEVNTALMLSSSGINLKDPASVASPNAIDPNLEAPITQALVAGIDRELMPNVALQVAYTYSRTSNLFGNNAATVTPRIGVPLGSYSAGPVLTGTLPDGSNYSVPTFVPAASGNGFLLTTIPGYYTDYNGVELGVTKRLAHRWMAHASFAYNNAREHLSSPDGRYDNSGNPTPTVTEPLVDGGQYAPATGAGGGAYYMNAKWQLNVNGMYEAPLGIQVAANLFGRQGYPVPIYRAQALGADSLNVLVSPRVDSFRYPDAWDADLRFAREFAGAGSVKIRVIGDVFNVFNGNAALLRVNNIGAKNFNALSQNVTPRILRLGVVVGF